MNDTLNNEINYIYLIKLREFVKSNENIYKIGRTSKINYTRFKQYPKDSILLFQMICNDCKKMEKQLIVLFKHKFIQKKEIGTEYFQGDYISMITDIANAIKNEK